MILLLLPSILLPALLAIGFVYRRIIYIVWRTLPRDLTILFRFVKVLLRVKWLIGRNKTVGQIFDELANKHPEKPCFYFQDEIWTYKNVQDFSNRVANHFLEKGYKKGDCIALFMENRVEYVCIWLGLGKIGVITALINHNLREQSLQHCVDVAKARSLIYGAELSPAVADVLKSDGFKSLDLFSFGEFEIPTNVKGSQQLEPLLKVSSTKKPTPLIVPCINDKLIYIYTSGTTGLPKASIIKNSRAIMGATIDTMIGMRRNDVLYTPLPLYHVQGGLVAAGQALMNGVPVVFVKKFSASRLWKDCVRYDVTVLQYMGEICRYLINQPITPEDKLHKVRLMFGNGIRAEIWKEFQDRFNNPIICELYGATEGNCTLMNTDGHVGAIGIIPRLLIPFFSQRLVKVHKSTGEILRDPITGFAIKCRPNEPGEMIGRIESNNPLREFQGYTDSSSNQKKILSDAFTKGDSYFRSGDVLAYDEFGYFYFKDRAGDTFRWKSENVSTAEVEGVVSKYNDLKDTVVFGVEIPKCEGRAGMLVIADPDASIDLEKLSAGINKELPAYARPLFLRISKEISRTGTYKLQKTDLQNDGYDVNKVTDKLYFLSNGNYTPLNQELYSSIISGKTRV